MAEMFLLTFFAEGILTKVALLATEQSSLAWGFGRELECLHQTVSKIQEILPDADAADEQPQDGGKEVQDWVKKLKDVADAADDVLDEINYEVFRRKLELHDHMKKKVLNLLSASNPILFRQKMRQRLQKINADFVNLRNEPCTTELVEKKKKSLAATSKRLAHTESFRSYHRVENIIGREEILSEIIATLINPNNQENLSVMAIVGMPGLGKTTLALSIYKELEKKNDFDKVIWIKVSIPFNVNSILNEISKFLSPTTAEITENQDGLEILKQELKGKRYFLVLDDVWNEDREKWEELKTVLSELDSARGRIIVTTSSAQVASITGTLKRCDLRCLSEDECWSILKHRAGIDDSAPMSPDLEKIGREIVKRCGGVPLVAQVFGSRMDNKTKEEWLSIQKTRTWDLPGGERILSDLKLSFDNLKSPFLKQCFAYCSMFKKDFEIEKDNLIQLWMAQGLLFHHSPNRSDQEMEDIGNEYFNTLWENCLFHDAKKDDCGTITKCKMHDVVHDFAELVAISESLTWDSNIDEMDRKRTIRHVAGVPTSVFEKTPEKLRSLFSNDAVPSEMLPKFTALRVLNLYQADIEELPSSIGKLKQLRYLNVSRTEIKELPTTIGMLHNLQTLRMQKCKNLKVFPKEVQDLVNLRHIYFDPVQEKRHINFGWYRELLVGIGKLTNLRTIPCFIVGLGHGIEELALLNKLKGILTIYDMEHVSAREEAMKANLVEKINIFKLTLVWSEERKRINNNDDDILQGLELPSNLETLEIHNFMGAKFSSWMPWVPLQSLKKIRLLQCNACEEVPIFGHLPKLTHVEIDTMSNLKSVGVRFYGYVGDAGVSTSEETKTLFPALKTLRICTTPNLIKWMEPSEMSTGKIVVFPFLEELTLSECPQLKDVPNHFPSLRQLKISICHELSSLQSVLDKCTSLQDLEISSCDGLTSMSIQSLRSLRKLVISFCGGLTSVGPLGPLGPQSGPEFYSPVSLEELSIKRCRRLEYIPTLYGCTSLRELTIAECDGLTTALKGLESCTSLRSLNIHTCKNLSYLPDGPQTLVSLECLSVHECPNLETLPSLYNLKFLSKLHIYNCGRLTSALNGLESCTSLRSMKIHACRNLSYLPHEPPSLVSLEYLSVSECPNLETLPSLYNLKFLSKLHIYNCGRLTSALNGLESCTSLRSLKIHACRNLSYLPDGPQTLFSLEYLSVSDCPSLETLPSLDSPTTLSELRIQNCDGLTSLPNGLASCMSLSSLTIWKCRKLQQFLTGLQCIMESKIGGLWEELDFFPSFPNFTQLERLTLSGWPKLKSLPQELQYCTSLRFLYIESFNGVESFPEWLGDLTSLQLLNIKSCKNLMHLPTAKAMQRLTKLKTLAIYDCPGLKERCTNERGPEWPKISHIPIIFVMD